MILRGRDRRRQMIEPEFLQPRQEALLLLAAKHPEHEFGGIRGAAPGDDGENEAGEKRMVEIGDAAPSCPLGLLLCGHALSPTSFVVGRKHISAVIASEAKQSIFPRVGTWIASLRSQ